MADAKDFVLSKISNNVYTLSPRRKGKSIIWSILSEIITENEHVLEGYLYCRKCNNVLKYSPKQTSNLSRHKCVQLLKQPAVFKSVTSEDKKAADNICAEWVSEDCQPFSAISGSGFMKLAKFLINIGAKYGEQVDIEALLPNEATLSRTTNKLADEIEIKDEIFETVQSGGASATIDESLDSVTESDCTETCLKEILPSDSTNIENSASTSGKGIYSRTALSNILELHTEMLEFKKEKTEKEFSFKEKELFFKEKEYALREREIELREKEIKSNEKLKIMELEMKERLAMEELKRKYK